MHIVRRESDSSYKIARPTTSRVAHRSSRQDMEEVVRSCSKCNKVSNLAAKAELIHWPWNTSVILLIVPYASSQRIHEPTIEPKEEVITTKTLRANFKEVL